MHDVFDKIKNHIGKRFIYGTGDGADKLIDSLEKEEIKIDGICTSDAFYRKRDFRSMTVYPISVLMKENPDAMFLMAFGTKQTDEILSLNKKANLIYPEMPVCGTNPFTKETILKNKEKIQAAYSLMADDLSKAVFENVIRFRLTGDLTYIKQCESSKDEGYSLLLRFPKEEIVVDCGAYNGDTADEFTEAFGGLKHLYAVEPCPKNFKKLQQKYGNFSLFNCAVGKEKGVADFVSSRGRGSVIFDGTKTAFSKTAKIDVNTVDELLHGEKCTVIKYDVEGEEENALLGSVNTVSTYHPNLLVAAYHKSEDIFTLPLLINSMFGKYKIYLRHHPCFPSWETNIYAKWDEN